LPVSDTHCTLTKPSVARRELASAIEDIVRILYHHRTLGDGAEGIHIREMADALRRLGHDVQVAGPVGEPGGTVGPPASGWARFARFVPDAAYEIAELGYNVVARRRLAEHVRRFRPEVIYDRYNTYSTAAVATGRKHQIPVLLEVNTIAYERVAYEQHRLRMPTVAAHYERWICNAADHVFAVSTPLARVLMNERDVHRARITVLPNGADPTVFTPAANSTIRSAVAPGGGIVIGFVGILRPWHGVDLFLDAFALLLGRGHDVRALLVGDGPMEDTLRRVATSRGIADRVTFTGRVPHARVRDHIAAMDIAVSPRATFYASPMKILEYMAMAKPVVAPAMDNIRDLIDDGRTGMLFTPDAPDDLVRRLEELIVSAQRRAAIGAAARRRIEESLNWGQNARIVTGVAERLLSAPKARR